MKGVKKAMKINLETHRSLKVCAGKKKGKTKVELIPLKKEHGVSKGNCDSSLLDQNMERIEEKCKSPNVNKVPLKDGDRKSWLEYKKLNQRKPVSDNINIPNSSLLDQNMERIEKKPKSPNVNKVPLKEGDRKSWLEFKKLNQGKPVPDNINIPNSVWEGRWPVKLDHPFVRVIGDFAIKSFNEVLQMHIEKDKSIKLCHHEIMDCKYLNYPDSHIFYLIMEAIEEGILGVYKTIVGCDMADGSTTLIRFILTDDRPVGKIATMLPQLMRLKSKYKTMKAMNKDLEISLEATNKSMEATSKSTEGKKNRGKVAAELIRLKEQHKAMKGICNVLYRQIRSQIPKTWNQRSDDPDSWSFHDFRASWLHRRKMYGDYYRRNLYALYNGFDFYTRSTEFIYFSIFG